MGSDDDLARQRIEEEMKKIQLESSRQRKEAMKKLVGDAQDVGSRKQGVDESVQKWAEKGTTKQGSVNVKVSGDGVKARKMAYAEQLEAFSNKGKSLEHLEGKNLSYENYKKFEVAPSSTAPSLFGTTDDDDGNDQPISKSQTSDFSNVESEEAIVLPNGEKRITITGYDHQGRKLTKTKIILAQNQQGSHSSNTNSNNETNSEEITQYYSLEDIRQRRVEGIDKNRREQYLSPTDFEKAFGMTKEEFAKLAKWKRDNLKRNLYLF